MSMGWRIIWRGIHPMKGEQVLDEEYPGNLNLRYNGGESADGQTILAPVLSTHE